MEYLRENERRTMRKEKIVESAAEFILTRDTEELANLTEEKVAKCIGVNRIHLSRRFKSDRDMTISNFIIREKIWRAYYILSKDNTKKIDELSIELGFQKVEDFNIKFENFLAIKPKDFQDIKEKSRYF